MQNSPVSGVSVVVKFAGQHRARVHFLVLFALTMISAPLRAQSNFLTFTPSSINFGSTGVGMQSKTIVVTATNNTSAEVGYQGYSNLDSFTFAPGTCETLSTGTMLGPGRSCTFSVQFTPSAVGTQVGDFVVSTSAGPATFHVSGAGVPTVSATVQGTLFGGYDVTGVFGPPNSPLTGPVAITYVFAADSSKESYTCSLDSNICGSSSSNMTGSATITIGGHSFTDASPVSVNRILEGFATYAPAAFNAGYATSATSVGIQGFPTITSAAWAPNFDWREPFSDTRVAQFPEGAEASVGQFIINTPTQSAGSYLIVDKVSQAPTAITCFADSITLTINNTTQKMPNILGGEVRGTLPNGDHYGNDQTTVNANVKSSSPLPLAVVLGDHDIAASEFGNPYASFPINEGLSVGALLDSNGDANLDYYSYINSSKSQHIEDQVRASVCDSQSAPLPIYQLNPYLAGVGSPRFDIGHSQVSNETYVDTSADPTYLQTFFKNATRGSLLSRFYFDTTDSSRGGWAISEANDAEDDTYSGQGEPDANTYCELDSEKNRTLCPKANDHGRLAAYFIYDAAYSNSVNPKVVITTLQKESSMVSATSVPVAKDKNGPHLLAVFDAAMGCRSGSFNTEIGCGSQRLKNDYIKQSVPHFPGPSPNAYFFPVNQDEKADYPEINVGYSIQYSYGSYCDGSYLNHSNCALVGLWLSNAATEAQYHYTPFVQTQNNGTYGGFRSFELFWFKYNSANWYQPK